MSKQKEIDRLKEAVRLAEKGGNYDTIHHDKLAAALEKAKPRAIKPPKEEKDAKSNR